MNNRRILPILYITVFLLTVSLCTSLIGANTNEPEIDSVSAILIDAHRGQILFEKTLKKNFIFPAPTKL